MNPDHLDALRLRLSNENIRLAAATTSSERAYREATVVQIEKEIAGELSFLGITDFHISDDDLLAALNYKELK